MPFIHIEEEKCSFGAKYCIASVAEISVVLTAIENEMGKSDF